MDSGGGEPIGVHRDDKEAVGIGREAFNHALAVGEGRRGADVGGGAIGVG